MAAELLNEVGRDAGRRRLQRISRLAEWVAVGAIVLVVAYCAYLLFDRNALISMLEHDVPSVSVVPTSGALFLAYALSIVPAALFTAAMWQARQLFHLFREGQVFGPQTSRHLVRLGGLAIAAAIAGCAMRTLVVLLMTSSNPPGQQHLIIGIGSNEVAALVAGLLFLAFALVMEEALRLQQDSQSIV